MPAGGWGYHAGQSAHLEPTCLGVLEEVNRTGEPVLVTRFGQPVAQVVSPVAAMRPKDWIGTFAAGVKVHGDIVGPVIDWSENEAFKK